MKQRQTGTTTKQIRLAPKGAIYVWPVSASLHYPRRIAESEGRQDIKFIPQSQFTLHEIRGRRVEAVVIDHAVVMNPDNYEAMDAFHDASRRSHNKTRQEGR